MIELAKYPGRYAHFVVLVLPVVASCTKTNIGAGDASRSMAEVATSEQEPLDSTDDFLFPWDCGATFRCTQGNNQGSHVGVDRWAWDFGFPAGTPVRAAKAGVVRVSINRVGPGDSCYYGCPSGDYACCNRCLNSFNQANVAHDDGTTSIYIHLNSATVPVNTRVNADDLLGYSGRSGCAFGAHLHYMAAAGSCSGYCQSIASSFADTPAVPSTGVDVRKTHCGGDGPTCPIGGGWYGPGRYCGASGISSGNPNTLYYCAGPGGPATVVEDCVYGCVVAPPGVDDYCAPQPIPTCPTGGNWFGAGRYCGSDGISGGDPDTLYYCSGPGQPATLVESCVYSCVAAPPGVDDYCADAPGK